jgi:hypothetical protein
VVYASPNGLIFIGPGGVRVITKDLFRRGDWQRYNPSSMRSDVYDDRYVAFYSEAGDDANESGALVIDPTEPLEQLVEVSTSATAVYRDPSDDTLYVVNSGVIRQFDSGGGEMPQFWLSKRFVTEPITNFAVCRVRMTATSDLTPAQRAAALAASKAAVTSQVRFPNGLITDTASRGGGIGCHSVAAYAVASGPYDAAAALIPDSETTVTIRFYTTDSDGERTLRLTKTITESATFSLPGGYKSDECEVEVSASNAELHSIALATTRAELSRSQA